MVESQLITEGEQLLKKTWSLCPVCLEEIRAFVVRRGDEVFIKKECEKHGQFEKHYVWNDFEIYKKITKMLKIPKDVKEKCLPKIMNYKPSYSLTLPIAQYCNLKCPMCFEGDAGHLKEPSKEELLNLTKGFAEKGVRVFHLTGKEITVSPKYDEYTQTLAENDIKAGIITNGIRLADINFAQKVKENGIEYVIISFDGFSEEIYQKIRGDPNAVYVLQKAVENTSSLGIPLQFSTTLSKGLNDNQIGQIVDYAYNHNVTMLRLRGLFHTGWAYNLGLRDMTTAEIMRAFIQQVPGITLDDIMDYSKYKYLLEQIRFYLSGFPMKDRRCAFHLQMKRENGKYVTPNRKLSFKLATFLMELLWKVKPVLIPFRGLFKKITPKLTPASPKRTNGFMNLYFVQEMDAYQIDLDLVEDCLNPYYYNGKAVPFCYYINILDEQRLPITSTAE